MTRPQNIIQQITDRAVEGRPRLLALDDTLDKLENDRLSLTKMIAEFDTSEPDMLAKIEDLRRRHNPEQTAVWMRNPLTMARGNGNEDAKRRLMPIVRQLERVR